LSDNILKQRSNIVGGVVVASKQTKKEVTKEQKPMRIIHTVPNMTDYERSMAKKRIGSDLCEIFSRVYSKLNVESETTYS
jgi:hypothetical protein